MCPAPKILLLPVVAPALHVQGYGLTESCGATIGQ
jgi:hypothetical protein